MSSHPSDDPAPGGGDARLLPSSEAALLPDVARDLRWLGWLVETLQPWLPLWVRRWGYDAAGRADAARVLARLAQPLTETALTLPGAAGAPQPARLYTPTRRAGEPTPLVVYVHGGGFTLGSLDSHAATCRVLAAETGWRVLAVTYRRAPEHPYPAAADDVLAAYAAVAAHPARYGAHASQPRLVLAGDSAGGQLVIQTALRLRDAAAGGAGDGAGAGAALPAPALLVPIYPAINSFKAHASKARYARTYGILTLADARAYAAGYLGATPAARERHARDAHLNPDLQADLSGLPRMLLLTAEFDLLHDEGVEFAQAARARGARGVEHIEATGRLHGCVQNVGRLPSSLATVKELAARMRACLGE